MFAPESVFMAGASDEPLARGASWYSDDVFRFKLIKKYLFIPIIEFSKYKHSLFLLVSKAFG